MRHAGALTVRSPAVLLYLGHLTLGDLWNQVFFTEQSITIGLGVIYTFYAALIGTAYLFWRTSPLAGGLMLPTCGWVGVASTLNLAVYRLNRN